MHNETPISTPSSANMAAAMVLRVAKQLHKAATGPSPSQSLPVLRRVLATQSLRGMTLNDLYHDRSSVRRKHILRTLALEAGYDSWEDYRAALADMRPADLTHFDLLRRDVGYPNQWFSSQEQANAYVAQHGGRVMNVGAQAVVLQD